MKTKLIYKLIIYFFLNIPFLIFSENLNEPFSTIEKIIIPYMTKQEVPGVAVALYYQDKIYQYTFGFADQENKIPVTNTTIFDIGSITKVMTSTLLACEIQAGKMHIYDPITKYLPQLLNTQAPIRHVTLVSLAAHTSGLPRGIPSYRHYTQKDIPLFPLVQFLQEWQPLKKNRKYLYSNLGYGLLGLAIADLEGTSYLSVLQKYLLTPLHMDSTSDTIPLSWQSRYAYGYLKGKRVGRTQYNPLLGGGGAIRSTSNDMVKFLIANLSVEGPPSLLSAMQVAQQGFFRVNAKLTLGLGWQRYQEGPLLYIDKNGGVPGFSSYIGMLPQEKIGIVILANSSKAGNTRIGRQILKLLKP